LAIALLRDAGIPVNVRRVVEGRWLYVAPADEEQALAGHFGIRSIPTLMIFREQVLVFEQAGALPKGALTDLLGQVRALDMEEVRRGADADTGG
jgi:thioredoxin-like negative regulator of GroEL